AVGHAENQVAVGHPGVQLDPVRWRAGRGGVHRVVEEVADDGDQVAGVHGAFRYLDVVGDGELDAALAGLCRLAQYQGSQDRFVDGGHHVVGQPLGDEEFGGGEVPGLVCPAQLDQRDDRVQPVGRLVRLCPERFGEAAYRVQLAGQRLQIGVVPQRHHAAEVPALPAGRRLVDDQYPGAGQVDLVDPLAALPQRAGYRLADRAGCEVEQPARLVIGQLQPAGPVAQEQPLPYRVE